MDGNNFINLDYSQATSTITEMNAACSEIVMSEINLNSKSTSQAMDAMVAAYDTLKKEVEFYKKILASDITNTMSACNILKSVDDGANSNVNNRFGAIVAPPGMTPTYGGVNPPYATTPPYATPNYGVNPPYATTPPYATPNYGVNPPYATATPPYATPNYGVNPPYATATPPYATPTPAPTP